MCSELAIVNKIHERGKLVVGSLGVGGGLLGASQRVVRGGRGRHGGPGMRGCRCGLIGGLGKLPKTDPNQPQ